MLSSSSNSDKCWNCEKHRFFSDPDHMDILTGAHNSNLKDCCSQRSNHHNCHTCHMQQGPFSHEAGQVLDNSAALLQRITNLFGNHELSDIQITVGNQMYHAHKLILGCSSEVFRVMLMNPSWPESQKATIVLKEEPQCIQVFGDFLRYLYTGAIHLSHLNVLPVLMLADKYSVNDLREVCVNYMCSHVVSIVHYNHAVSWLQYADLCNHPRLAECCQHFILCNFNKVMSSSDFLLMERDTLEEFLARSDLVVPDEFTLYKGICHWLRHQETRMDTSMLDFKDMVLQLLSHIRYPMMLPAQLCQLEHDIFVSVYRNFFIERISCALEYHSASAKQRKDIASISGASVQYQPRNYINDTWSTSLAIDNFPLLPEHDVRPLFFASPISGSVADENQSWDWSFDLFPKGIQFQKCIMIGFFRNMELCGATYKTVRLSLKAKSPEPRRVDVAVLIMGVQDNVEYIKHMVQRCCYFDEHNQVCQFNDLVPFEALNSESSDFLSGSDGDEFKICIIIKPLVHER